jgi:hypothetical protein
LLIPPPTQDKEIKFLRKHSDPKVGQPLVVHITIVTFGRLYPTVKVRTRRRQCFAHPTPSVTRLSLCITRHTSHVTRHTSHVTRHTSHHHAIGDGIMPKLDPDGLSDVSTIDWDRDLDGNIHRDHETRTVTARPCCSQRVVTRRRC